ncbi:MAG: hypothetical protein O2954_00755 [bacterium]|nr:hypothetical protein [bacterium]
MNNRAAAGWIGIFFLCLYLLTASGHYGGDGFWIYLTAESIVLDGDLAIGDRPFLIPEMQNQYAAGPGGGITAEMGRTYSPYGLGLALFEIPLYTMGRLASRILPSIPSDYITMFTVSMTNTGIAAAWCVLFFLFGRNLGYSKYTCLFLTGIFGLGSLTFPYASYGFSEPLLGLTFLGTAFALHTYRQSGKPIALAFAGALAGLVVLTKIYAVITLPLFAIYLWADLRSRPLKVRTLAALLIPLAFFAILAAWYNWARYGGILKTGYHLVDFDRIGGFLNLNPVQFATGLFGLLLSPGRGLLPFLPVALLTPFAFRKWAFSHRRETWLFAALLVEHLLFYAFYGNWHGGHSLGSRFLLPVLPFLLLPLGSLLETKSLQRTVAFSLGVIGILIHLPLSLINYHLFTRFALEKILVTPDRVEELFFSPLFYPPLGAYYQIASAASRFFMGTALNYPAYPLLAPSLENYDMLDLWWINALRTGFLGTGSTLAMFFGLALLVFGCVYSLKKLIQWIGAPENPNQTSPHPL